MARGSPWPTEHLELLKRAVLEKQMPISALLILFPGKTASSIRSQLNRHNLPVIPEDRCTPDLDFFNSFVPGAPPKVM